MTNNSNSFRPIYLLILLSSFFCNTAIAQSDFITMYSGNGAGAGMKIYTSCPTNDGGLALVGRTDNFGVGGYDGIIIRLDASGDTVFVKTYGGNDYDKLYQIAETPTGDFVFGGYTESFGAGQEDGLVGKIDEDGNLLWTRVCGGAGVDKFYGLEATSDGGAIAVGYTYSGPTSIKSEYVVKLGPNGQEEWTYITSNGEAGVINNVVATSDGGYVYVADRDDGFGYDDVCLTKLDFAGNMLWSMLYEADFEEDSEGIVETPDGGLAVCGYTNSFGNMSKNILVMKMDSQGNLVWSKIYGGAGSDYGVLDPITVTQDGGFAIAGYSNSINSEYDMFGMKINETGSVEWANLIGGVEDTKAYGVNQLANGNIVLIGRSNTWSSSYSALTVVIPADGDLSGECYADAWNVSEQSVSFVQSSVSYTAYNTMGSYFVIQQTTNPTINIVSGDFTTKIISTDIPCGESCTGTASAVPSFIVNSPILYSWDNGTLGADINNLCQGEYEVVVTDVTGCTAMATVTIGNAQIDPIEICVITVDNSSTKNLIVWDKPVADYIESFNIYRKINNVYDLIGNVDYDSLSHYTDETNGINPAITSYRYKISAIDSCSNESELSLPHETIHVVTNFGQGSVINLVWDPYEGFMYDYYRILRDDFGTGNFQQIDSVLNTNTTYTDFASPSPNAVYVIEIVAPSCSATKAVSYNNSRSNVAGLNDLKVKEQSNTDQISIYPNPATSVITISSKNIGDTNFEIIDILGNRVNTGVLSQNIATIDISTFARGHYLVNLSNNNLSTTKQLIVH